MKTRGNLFRIILITVCAFLAAMPLTAEDGIQETANERDARMQWWREARFGMFIHWGVYSVPAGIHKGQPVGGFSEWIMDKGKIPIPEYEEYAKQFTPVKFDADAWVKIAKNAGMKYIVITSKHHDGFCMWDSKVSDYDIMDASPFKRDVLKELADACTKHGIRLCFYHSIMDWHHPDAKGDNFSRYRDEYMIPQLKELLSGNYGDIGVLWFDGEWIKEWTEPQGKALYKLLREIKPDLIINNRVGKGRNGMQGMNKDNGYAGDFGTPEQQIPATGFGPGVDWESCMTMNDHWGYTSNDHKWKSEKDLIRKLIDIASKGGNFLLNVGPTAEGVIPQPSVERLQEVGRWMRVNGEAIYGTKKNPFPRALPWGTATQRPGLLYLHVLDWPGDGALYVPLTNKAARAYLLADPGGTLTTTARSGEQDAPGIIISLPSQSPDPIASVVALEIEGAPQPVVAAPLVRQAADGSITLPATQAQIHGGIFLEKIGNGPLNIGNWCSGDATVDWRVMVSHPGVYDVIAQYACAPEAGGEFTLHAGSATLQAAIAPTSGWDDFTEATVGQITLEQTGHIVVGMKAVRNPKRGLVNLRALVLRPRE